MNRVTAFLFFTLTALGAVFFVIAPILVKTIFVFKAPAVSAEQPASVFFIESSTPEMLKQLALQTDTTTRKLKVLVVPGHDSDFWGTQYKNVKEADMTLALSKELVRLLSWDDKFEVSVTRDGSGYTPVFADYFSDPGQNILSFVAAKKKTMTDLELAGKVSLKTDGVFHNNAPSPVVVRLYGINKWANENNIDLVIHVHFNDYPRRKRASPGDYSGFSIYVPEHQYSNARASKDIAEAVSEQLQTYYSQSDMPKEDVGVVEDQDLIAIGSFNTLDPASILIEYGYIYEPQFLNPTIRNKVIQDLATQTYIGIHKFFGSSMPGLAGKYNTAFLPNTWQGLIAAGVQHNLSILSLQAALTLEGVYPPEGMDKRNCPVAGTFGKCTRLALTAFQQKYGVSDEPGVLGQGTIATLNKLYGE